MSQRPIDPELLRASQAYVDRMFGPGAGEKHSRFLDHLADPALRETLHRYHALEADTTHLSMEENYLIGVVLLAAERSYATAGMFAKTLMHLGTPKAKILAAVTRLSMYKGGLHAAEAAAHLQRAIAEYEARGVASLEAWFPPEPR